MKKISVLIIMIAVCKCNLAFAEYVSIQDVYAETRDGWHETYEAYGRTIRIDCDIDVPDVDKLPLLLISHDESKEIHIDTSDPIHYKGLTAYFDTDFSDEFPEHNTLNPSEAWSILENTLDSSALEMNDFAILGPISTSCVHQFDEATKTVGECISEKGSYMYTGYQRLHGIPLFVPWNYECGNMPGLVYPYFRAYIYDDQKYTITFDDAVREEGILLDDIPLLRFSDIRREYEKLISAGLLRDVFEIRLVYFPFLQKGDPSILVAVPMWNVIGDYQENAKSESKKWETQEEQAIMQRNLALGWGMSAPPVFAQGGKIVNLSNTAPDRNTVPKILSWNELNMEKGVPQ